MRIVSIQVQGFGVLQERTLDTDSPFALFYGANEAGKSTLMGFVRAVLFGFPSRANRAERYEPPMGGAHGGALTLLDGQGQLIRVERYDGSTGGRRSSAGIVKVTLGDGTTGGEELLHALLGGLSADLFRSLFAFGLSELQELRTLQSDEISGYLYSAGLGVSGSAIMEAERKLAAQADSLFKPRGRNQEINLLLKELEELAQSIRRSKERIGEYDRLLEERRSLEERIAKQDLRRQTLRRELDELAIGSKARASWIRLKQIADELQELPAWETFPEHAAARLETLEDELARYNEEEIQLDLKQEELKSKLQFIVLNNELLTHTVTLNSLLEEAPLYQESGRALLELEAQLSLLRLEIERLLKQLDERWEPETLAAFPVSLSLRDRIRHYRERFTELQEKTRRLHGEQESLSLQMDRIQESVMEQEHELQAANSSYSKARALPGFEADEAEDPARSLNRIARDYSQWRLLRSELKHLHERMADREQHRLELLEASTQDKIQASQRQRFLAFAMAGIGILLSAALLWRGERLFSGIAFVTGVGTFIYLYLSASHTLSRPFIHSANKRGRSFRPSQENFNSSNQDEDKLRSIEQQLKVLEHHLQLQVGRWFGGQEAAASREHGTSISTSSHQADGSWLSVLEWLETSFEDVRQEAEQWRNQRGELQHKHEKLQDTRKSLHMLLRQDDQLTEELQQTVLQLDQLQTQWSEWTLSIGFSGELSPDTLLESLQLVERGHELLRRQEQMEVKMKSCKQLLSRFESETNLHLGPTAGKEPLLALKRWKEQELEQLRLQEEHERIRQQLVQCEQDRHMLEERVKRASEKLDHLLKEASAEHGEQLRQNQSKAQQRMKLMEEQKLLNGMMEALAGSSFLPRLRALLDEVGEEELERRSSNLEQQIKLFEEETNEWRELSGRLSSEIEKLELGTEHTDKLQKLEEHRSSLQQLVDQYAVISFASLLMKKARDVYERDRQPGVLIRASAYFEQMTQGRYTQIKAPFGEQRLVAMQQNGSTLDTGYLSRGTAEQLYLSMRFALAEEYAGKAVLPLVMDDILVNFDEQRMESCLDVLRELSGRHQILLFTCHAHVRDAAKRLIPEHGLIEL